MTAGALPAYLAADWRYAGDDWSGDNALTYIVYATAPVYADDGVTITTPGVPRDLTGFSVTGTLRYMPNRGVCKEPVSAPPLVSITGAIVNAAAGLISLSLSAAQTIFPRQALSDFGDPRRALLVAQPKVVDAQGNAMTVGLQPLFVF